jgi:hypothetical protein
MEGFNKDHMFQTQGTVKNNPNNIHHVKSHSVLGPLPPGSSPDEVTLPHNNSAIHISYSPDKQQGPTSASKHIKSMNKLPPSTKDVTVTLMPPIKTSGVASSIVEDQYDTYIDDDLSKYKSNTLQQTTNVNSTKSLVFPALTNLR